MKKLIFTLILTAFGSTVFAQDIILQKDADEILAKVTKVSKTEIEYLRWDNLDGPIYTLSSDEVLFIKYQNGNKDIISSFSGRTTASKSKTKYQGEVSFGYGLAVGAAAEYLGLDRLAFETVHGYRAPYFFAGVGLGFNYFYQNTDFYYNHSYCYSSGTAGVLPLFADFKGYCPIGPKTSLFLAWDLGAVVGVLGWLEGSGFYTSVGPGIDFGSHEGAPRGDIGIRFQYMGSGLNAILFRVGFKF